MNILSLFDGISCGRVGLERAGIRVDKYYASEIDRYAIQVALKNYPDTIELGDVKDIDFAQFVGKVDMIIGGSPCQDLSISGKRAGLKGERSGLFYKFVEAIQTIKPKYFLLENNVGMPREAYLEMSRLMGCYPVEINSALVSAQNRRRYYWTNIRLKENDFFDIPTSDIPQPEDRGILLKDILEDDAVPHKDKSRSLTATYYKGAGAYPIECYLRHQERPFACVRVGELGKGGMAERIYSIDGKSVALRANGGGGGANTGLYAVGRYVRNYSQNTKIYSVKGKAITLMAKGGGMGGCTGSYKIDLPDGDYIIRKLTPLECERLQTLPDGYTEGISNTQRYKCLGNGWTVDVIAHIFKFIDKEKIK